MKKKEFAVAISLALSAMPVLAQSQLEEIVVIGTRMETELGKVPQAVSVVGARDIQLGTQELGLDESLSRVPGVVMQNRYNFAQDLRVSIRGFGSRASFGIRGIRVLADGIPMTLPDGQSGTDDLDLGSAQSIEVVRGPSASLYGTAAGGVISLTTEEGSADPFIDTKFTFGDYGQQKYQFKAGGENGKLSYLVNASYLEVEGYRDHSEVEHSLINTKFRYRFDDSADLLVIANAVDSPIAQDSGGLTLADVEADPTQAQARNLSSNAGESFDQQRLGLVYTKRLDAQQQFIVRGYSMWKDFETFLPIGTHIPFVGDDGVSAFSREFFGGGATYQRDGTLFGHDNRLTVGVDLDYQRDDRQRYLNNAGIKGDLTFDQLESADSRGFYIRDEFSLTDQLLFSLAGRYDDLTLEVDDHYLDNGDQSAELDFEEFSPAAGLMWNQSEQLNLYVNYATSFETPTFTELGSPAQELNVNLGGFNNVRAQEADSYEIGAKGMLNDRIFYDLAVFTMDVEDEITSVVNIGSRAFFENADTERRGLEAQLQANLVEGLDMTLSYTLSDFTFSSFDNTPEAVGQWIPGIPKHQFFAELDYTHHSGFYVIWDNLFVGKFYADNANTEEVDGYVVSNLRMGKSFEFSDAVVSPFFGINNLFDEEYFSNVRLNAFGGRAYEPAPERNIYGGVNIRF